MTGYDVTQDPSSGGVGSRRPGFRGSRPSKIAKGGATGRIDSDIQLYVFTYNETVGLVVWMEREAELEMKKSYGTIKRVRMENSSGNVFADLGLPHPEQELLKAKLTLQIYRLIKARGITQTEAGKILGIKQPHVSALMRNRSGSFSVERLMEFLTALGQDVEISVRPAKGHGEVSVVG